MRITIYLLGTLILLYVSSCKTKCATCPGMKPNKYQKEAKKMEKEMNRQAKKEQKKAK